MLLSSRWGPAFATLECENSRRTCSSSRSGALRTVPLRDGLTLRACRAGRHEFAKYHSSQTINYLDGDAFHDDDERAASDDAACVISTKMMEDDDDDVNRRRQMNNKSSLLPVDGCYAASPCSSSSTCIAMSAITNARPTTGTTRTTSGTKRCSTGSG